MKIVEIENVPAELSLQIERSATKTGKQTFRKVTICDQDGGSGAQPGILHGANQVVVHSQP